MLKMALKGRPANLANLNLSLVDVKRYLSRNGPISGPHGESFVRAEMVDGGDLEFKNNQTPSLFDLLNLVYNSLDCYLRRDGAPAGRLIRSGEDLDFFDENYDGTIESRFPDICWVEEESWKQLKSGDIELTQIPLLAKFGVKLMTPLFGVPAWMRQRQIADCMQRGSYEIIWLLDPFGKTMSVYRKAEDGFKFDSDLPWKSLDGGSLFPGFKLDVSLIDLSLLGDCFDWSTVSACDWCHQRLNHLPAMQSVQYVLDEGGMSLEPLVVDVPLEVEYHSEELQTPPRIENSSPITSLSRIDTYSGENGRPAPFVPDSPVHLVDLDETDAKPEKRRRSGTVAETKPVKGSRRKSGSRPSVEDQEHKEELMELMAETVTKGDPVNLKVLGITMEDVLKHMEMYGPWYGPNGTKLIKLYLDDESNLQFGEQVLESKRGVMNLLEPLITAYTKYKSLPGHVYCDMEEIEARIYKEDDESRLEPDLLWFDEETWESMTDLERATPSVRALKAQFILLVANYEADAALETLREEKIDLFFTQGNCKLLWFVDSLEVDHVCEFRKSKSARGYTRRGKQLEGGDVFPGLLILEKIVKKAAIQDCGHYLGTIYSCTHCPLLFMSERGQYIHEMGEHTGVMKTTARRRKSVPR